MQSDKYQSAHKKPIPALHVSWQHGRFGLLGSGVPVTRSTATPVVSKARHEIDVATPYRLDLTVSALRRLSTNIVDVLTPEGHYVRAFDAARGPLFVRVAQERPDALVVTLECETNPSEHSWVLAIVRRMLGVDRELSRFNRSAARIPWLRPLAARMRGVKPPRYPTLWEACVNAIIFQQLSLSAASSISRRLIIELGSPIARANITLHAFPSAESFQGVNDAVLRATGLSSNKLATLRRVAEALLSGTLDEAMLEERPSQDAVTLLRRIKGIGPWTATVILLRGLGRLDVFPMNDSSVASNLAFVAGSAPVDINQVLTALGPQRGMLYYHLLLARLDARSDLGRASFS
jgi:DNA-3-methyladenine glycosylase II